MVLATVNSLAERRKRREQPVLDTVERAGFAGRQEGLPSDTGCGRLPPRLPAFRRLEPAEAPLGRGCLRGCSVREFPVVPEPVMG